MKLERFVFISAIILLVGLNLAGRGIQGVVGEGPWQALNYKLVQNGIEFTVFGRDYHFDYGPLKEVTRQSLQAVKNEMMPKAAEWLEELKQQSAVLLHKGKVAVLTIWENTQEKVARFTGE